MGICWMRARMYSMRWQCGWKSLQDTFSVLSHFSHVLDQKLYADYSSQWLRRCVANEPDSLVTGNSTFTIRCRIFGLMAEHFPMHWNIKLPSSCAKVVNFIIVETLPISVHDSWTINLSFILKCLLCSLFRGYLLWKFALVYESAFNYLAIPLAANLEYDEEKSSVDLIKVRIDSHENCFRSACTLQLHVCNGVDTSHKSHCER